jgi:hypothetical protein
LSPAGNQQGRVTAMTLITQLRPGGTSWLRILFWLAAHLPLPSLTLLRLKGIHFARWSLLTHLPPGGPQRSRRRLRTPLLFFESNYNGSFHGYIDAFSYVFPLGMRLIWGSSLQFPGALPVTDFKPWISERELECSHYYAAYPEATTRAVLSALAVHERLPALVRDGEEMDPERFRAAYDKLLAKLQLHL